MSKAQQSLQNILQQGLLPLYFHASSEVSRNVLQALYDAGIRTVEYTNRGETALQNFKDLLAFRDNALPGLELGIGTIKTTADAQAFLNAGADYIVCPGLIPAVIRTVQAAGRLCIPGCMTTSEIIAAEELGCTFVKLFPGNLIGPGYVSAIRDIFPDLQFMPTGGVDTTPENIRSWFEAGVSAVGMGSKLISKTLLEEARYAEILTATEKVLAIVQSIK